LRAVFGVEGLLAGLLEGLFESHFQRWGLLEGLLGYVRNRSSIAIRGVSGSIAASLPNVMTSTKPFPEGITLQVT
jgi:hypothetical protein